MHLAALSRLVCNNARYVNQNQCSTCPVGCALIYPQFMEICGSHMEAMDSLDATAFEGFEQQCLDQDALALVE